MVYNFVIENNKTSGYMVIAIYCLSRLKVQGSEFRA
jgi:hypothetical protein